MSLPDDRWAEFDAFRDETRRELVAVRRGAKDDDRAILSAVTRSLNALRETQSEHGEQLRTLAEGVTVLAGGQHVHGIVLDEHTRTLDKHTRILDEHTRTLDKHTGILDDHTRRLDALADVVSRMAVDVSELKTDMTTVKADVVDLKTGQAEILQILRGGSRSAGDG